MASTLAEPVNDWAPIWRARVPSSSAMTAPNGMVTSIVGMIVTLATNQACCTNSRNWNGRLNVMRPTSRNIANKRPDCLSPPTGERDGISLARRVRGLARRRVGLRRFRGLLGRVGR
jgi:hypothetical protein